jgi:hypothetical protein
VAATLDSSRFLGSLTAILPAQQRAVRPPFDINRSICVGMFLVTAINTNEARLALAATFVDTAASRTGLRSVCGVDANKVASAFFKLVGK